MFAGLKLKVRSEALPITSRCASRSGVASRATAASDTPFATRSRSGEPVSLWNGTTTIFGIGGWRCRQTDCAPSVKQDGARRRRPTATTACRGCRSGMMPAGATAAVG